MANLYLSGGINRVLQRHFPTEYAKAVGLLRQHTEREVKPKFAELFDELLTSKLDQIDRTRQRIADDYQHNTDQDARDKMRERHAELGKYRTDIAHVIRELPKAQLKANVGFGSKLIQNFARGREKVGDKSMLGMVKNGLKKVQSDLVGPDARRSMKKGIVNSLKKMIGLDRLNSYSNMHKNNFSKSLDSTLRKRS